MAVSVYWKMPAALTMRQAWSVYETTLGERRGSSIVTAMHDTVPPSHHNVWTTGE